MLSISSTTFSESALSLEYILANSTALPQLVYTLIYNPGGFVGHEVETKAFHSRMNSASAVVFEIAVPDLPRDWDPAHPLNCLGVILQPGESYIGSIAAPVPIPQIAPYQPALQSGNTKVANFVLLRIGRIPLGQNIIPRQFPFRGAVYSEVSQTTAHLFQVVEETMLRGVSIPVFVPD
jgi:hypothetical protein